MVCIVPGIDPTELARIDQALKTQLDILRHSAATEGEVLRVLERMKKELIAKLAQGNITEWGRARLNQMLKEASATIAEYYAKAQDILSPTYQTVAGISAAQTATALAVTAPSRAVLESLVSNMLVEGAPMKAWWAKQSADTAFKFASAVRQGIAQSETLNQIFKRVGDATDLANRNSIALVHTSVMQVMNDANVAVLEKNADIAPTMRYLATLDSHTCLRCSPRDGLEWDTLTHKPVGHDLAYIQPPIHVGCLTADSLVSAIDDITGTFKRWFDGKVIIIKTASGRKLTCTPNHPILTSGGWVAAGALNVGGDVIRHGICEGRIGVDGDGKNVPPSIHDCIEAFLSARQVVAVPVPVSAPDFHNDGEGSKIAIVYSDGLLGRSINATGAKHVSESDFVSPTLYGERFFHGLRTFDFCCDEGRLPTNSIMRGLRKLGKLLWRGMLHARKLLFAAVPRFDTGIAQGAHQRVAGDTQSSGSAGHPPPSFNEAQGGGNVSLKQSPGSIHPSGIEPANDDVEAYAALAGELLAGSAGSVAADKIINIEVRNFSGHVYNLETVKGWYVANGIVTHNCRCKMIPVTRLTDFGVGTELEGQRASSAGPASSSTTFTQFLKRQTPEFQAEVLGKGRAELFRSGKITLRDLVSGKGAPLSLKQLERKYA